jgi:RNA polymerase sigma-70 factor (ECF subfamily)
MDLLTTDGERWISWDFPDPSPNPEQHYATCQTSAILARALEKLPKKSRQLLEHYHRDEGKMVDIANAIGITVGAAKSRLLRARRLLRHDLKAASVTD